MAGSIFKKLRGLLAKFWAKLQLFLKRDGLRVDIKKDGGFFNKKIQTEMVSSDRDRRISI